MHQLSPSSQSAESRAETIATTAQEIAATEARERGYKIAPGAAYIDLVIPSRISHEQLAHIGELLALSEAQYQPFFNLYEQYIEDDWDLRAEHAQPLWDRSAELQSAGTHNRSVKGAEQFAQLMTDRGGFVKLLASLEDRLFTDMIPFLIPEQIERLDRARNLLTRYRCRASHGKFPGSNVDLSAKLFNIQRTAMAPIALNHPQFDLHLADYESRATRLFESALAQRLETILSGTRIRAQLNESAMSRASPDQLTNTIESLQSAFKEQTNALLRANRAIHDLNRKYVAIFSDDLSEEHALELIHWFRNDVYRPVYPDIHDIAEIIDASLQLEGVSENTYAILKAKQLEFQDRQNELSRSMIREYLAWWEHVEVQSGYRLDLYEQYTARLQELQTRRQQNAQRGIELITAMLSPDQVDTLAPLLQTYADKVDAFNKRRHELQQHSRFDWPDPYD